MCSARSAELDENIVLTRDLDFYKRITVPALRGRARMVGHDRGGRGAIGWGTPIENVRYQGDASQTQ